MAGRGIRSKASVTTADGTTHASNAMLHAATSAREHVLAAGQSTAAANDVARAAAAHHAPATAHHDASEPAWKRYQRMADEHRAARVAQAKPAETPKPAPSPAAAAKLTSPLSKDHQEALSMLRENKSVTVTPAAAERLAIFHDLAARGHAEASAPNERGHVTFRLPGTAAAHAAPKAAAEAPKKGMIMPRLQVRGDAGVKSALGKLSKHDLGLVASVTNAMARGDWGYASKMKPHELERAEQIMTAMGMI